MADDRGGIDVRVLGALEIGRPGEQPETVRGLGGRLLLALAVDHGTPVPDHDLLDRLWPSGPPNQAIASVRNQVARLRRLLGAAVVERTARGYRLNPASCRVDVDALADALAVARTLEPGPAAELIDVSLAAVRGRPFDDVADEVWAMPAAAAAAEVVASAEELWADAAIASGRAAVEITRLRRASVAQPHREVRWRQLVGALAAAGRRTEGLRAVGEARRALAEFGLLPGPDLLALEGDLVGAPTEGSSVSRIPVRRGPMVARELELAALLRPERVIWIEGAPGAGTTRLLAELADRQADGQVVLLYAAGDDVVASLAGAARELAAEADAMPDDGLVARLQLASSRRQVIAIVDDVHRVGESTVGELLDVIAATRDAVRWILAGRPIERHAPAGRLRAELDRIAAVCSVSIGALTADDVGELVDLLAPGADPADRAALTAEVMSSTRGHTLAAAELIEHRRSGAAGDPPRLDAVVEDSIRALSPDGRRLVDVLAVAAGPCPVAVLASACGLDAAAVLQLAEGLEVDGLLAPVTSTKLDLRHELVRRAVVRRLSPATQLDLRRRLVHRLGDDPRFVVAYADQLVRCGDLLEEQLRPCRDRAVAEAIDRLMADTEYHAARRLAERYLAVADVPCSGPLERRATLRAATALIAAGAVAEGRAPLQRVMEQARADDDRAVLADAILAMGPLTLGVREGDQVVCDAERLAATLPESEARRRVQLACWAAHHRVNRGEAVGAAYLLRLAEQTSATTPDLRGLILAVRAQAATLVGAGPVGARCALDELKDFARSSGDSTAEGAWLLLNSRQSWIDGTVTDVAAARDAIADMATRMPRPDLQWWPLALDAAIELATGSERAIVAIDEAARTGRQLGVEVAGNTALAQHLLLLFVNGEWAAAAGAFGGLATNEDASPSLLAAFGMACAEAGRLDAVADVAARLSSAPQLLVGSGMTWGQVAAGATAVAFAVGDTALAESLWRSLEPYSGTGLALPGAGYFGAADRCLGLLAATMGDRQRALALLTSACAQERRRGATLWEQRAAADLHTVRSRVFPSVRVRGAGLAGS